MMESDGSPGKIHPGCPYFGTKIDPHTKFMYPAPEGTCHARKKLSYIPLEHQGSYCLSDQYVNCPIYNRPKQTPISGRKRTYLTLAILLLLSIISLAALSTWLFKGTGVESIFALSSPTGTGNLPLKSSNDGEGSSAQPTSTRFASLSPTASSASDLAGRQQIETAVPTTLPNQTNTPTATLLPTETPSPTPTTTNTPTSSPTPTITPSPTATASPTSTQTATLQPTTVVPIFTFPTTIPSPPPNTSGQPGLPGGGLPSSGPAQPTATKISLSR